MSTDARFPEPTPVTADRPVYVTQYAITKGILTFTEGRLLAGANGNAYFSDLVPGRSNTHVFTREWFPTLKAAQADVRKKVRAKLAALDRQRAKLEKLLAAMGSSK